MSITPMQAGSLKPIVDRTGRESAKYQHIRELLRNAFEANATKVVVRPEWGAVEALGVFRLLCADDGNGMEAEHQLPHFMNTFGGGGKPIGDVHENFGMGAKTSMLPWNHAGLIVASRQGGSTAAVMLTYDPSIGEHGEYGLTRWEVEDDEGSVTYDEVLNLDIQEDDFVLVPGTTARDVMDAFLNPDHGTVMIACGMTGKENTFLATGEGGHSDAEGDIKGISKYINERLYDLPADIEVHELRTDKANEWPRSAADAYGPQQQPIDRRINRRTLRGARYYLQEAEYKHPASGTEVMSDGTQVHWSLWGEKDDRKYIHSYARRLGYIAVLYDGELYHLTDHAFAYRRFGIVKPEVRRRLTLILEPPVENRLTGAQGVYPHAARSSLLWSGAKELPLDTWGQEFVEEHLPEAIRDAIMKAGSSDEQDPDAGEWLNQIAAKFRARFRRVRIVFKKGGSKKANFGEGSGPIGGGGKGSGGGSTGTGTGGGGSGRPRARKPSAQGEEGEEHSVKEGLPTFRWVTEDELGEPGRAAVFLESSASAGGGAEVLLNREFPAFVELFQYWTAVYPPHYEQDVLRAVELVYGTELAAKVAHAHELKGDKNWNAEQFKLMLSPEALTLAALGLYSCDQVINTMLGAKLGKKGAKASAT